MDAYMLQHCMTGILEHVDRICIIVASATMHFKKIRSIADNDARTQKLVS
jgi:hypothetical protein